MKPNLLLITTDQQRWDALSCLAPPGYRTPHLDRLAAYGIHFNRAYTPSPVCTPARVSMLTGQYPTRHGAYQIGMEAVPALEGPLLPGLLGAAGYATASIGKTHYLARRLEEKHIAGYAHPQLEDPDPVESFWKTFDGPYLGFDFLRHCQSHACDQAPNGHYRAWLKRRGRNVDHLHHAKDASGKVIRKLEPSIGSWAIDPEDHQTAWITAESMAWIEQQQAAGRSWFCMANYQDPHPPFVCPEPYFRGVDMSGVNLGGMQAGEGEGKPTPLRNFLQGRYWTDEAGQSLGCPVNRNLPALGLNKMGKEEVALCIQAYIGMVNMLDDYLGRLFAHLQRLGAWENTIILFTSDHGEQLNRHGLWGKGAAMFDDNIRIPAILAWPGRQPAAVNERAMFNLVDILPTFLDAAGVQIPPGVQGVSQMPILRGERDCVRDWALVDFLASPLYHLQALIFEDHKLVLDRDREEGELYDLGADPDQNRNRFADPAMAERKLRMMQKLCQVQMAAAGTMPARVSYA